MPEPFPLMELPEENRRALKRHIHSIAGHEVTQLIERLKPSFEDARVGWFVRDDVEWQEWLYEILVEELSRSRGKLVR